MGERAAEPAPWLARVAAISRRTSTVSELVDALLLVLQELTQLDSTYLTRIDWDQGVQEVVQSLNVGTLKMPEGLIVPWGDTLCRRTLEEGRAWADDVPERWGDSDAARSLGIQTYVSTPVYALDLETPWGTLCGVSAVSRPADEDIVATLTLFARLISAALRDEALARAARDRADEAERILRMRTELIATAEHALKAPAATVKMWSEMLLDHADRLTAAQRQDAVQRIGAAADRLLALLQALVEKARGDLLQHDVILAPVDLRAVAAHVAARVSTRKHPMHVEAGARVAGLADAGALDLALEHLLDNVRAHTPPGTRTVLTAATDGEEAVLVVRDDGPGLPAGVDVFEPFVRGNLEHALGTGLGLAIVRTLVDACGGTVVGSSDGGAVFTITLTAA